MPERTRSQVGREIVDIDSKIAELQNERYWLRQELLDLPCEHLDLTGNYTCDECGAFVEDLELIQSQDDYRVLEADVYGFHAEHADVATMLPRRSEYFTYA